MKLNAFFKTFLMAVVGFIATLISKDLSLVSFWYVVIGVCGFTLIYMGKNYVLPSTSEPWKLNLWDFISGGIIAVGYVISDSLAMWVTAGKVDWHGLGTAILVVLVGYFTKTTPTATKT